jgi:hypothetical protein
VRRGERPGHIERSTLYRGLLCLSRIEVDEEVSPLEAKQAAVVAEVDRSDDTSSSAVREQDGLTEQAKTMARTTSAGSERAEASRLYATVQVPECYERLNIVRAAEAKVDGWSALETANQLLREAQDYWPVDIANVEKDLTVPVGDAFRNAYLLWHRGVCRTRGHPNGDYDDDETFRVEDRATADREVEQSLEVMARFYDHLDKRLAAESTSSMGTARRDPVALGSASRVGGSHVTQQSSVPFSLAEFRRVEDECLPKEAALRRRWDKLDESTRSDHGGSDSGDDEGVSEDFSALSVSWGREAPFFDMPFNPVEQEYSPRWTRALTYLAGRRSEWKNRRVARERVRCRSQEGRGV